MKTKEKNHHTLFVLSEKLMKNVVLKSKFHHKLIFKLINSQYKPVSRGMSSRIACADINTTTTEKKNKSTQIVIVDLFYFIKIKGLLYINKLARRAKKKVK